MDTKKIRASPSFGLNFGLSTPPIILALAAELRQQEKRKMQDEQERLEEQARADGIANMKEAERKRVETLDAGKRPRPYPKLHTGFNRRRNRRLVKN